MGKKRTSSAKEGGKRERQERVNNDLMKIMGPAEVMTDKSLQGG